MSPNPGWYPAPDAAPGAGELRWWDGGQWTPHTTTEQVLQSQARASRPGLGRGYFVLASVVSGLCRLGALLAVVDLAVVVWTGRQIAAWREHPRQVDLSDAELVDRLAVVSVLTWVGFVATLGVCFIVWLYRGHHSDRVDPAALRHDSGWAIGGWFVPILNLWRPLQMVHDLRRGASAGGGPLVNAWWGFLLASWFLGTVSYALVPDEDDGWRETLAALQASTWVDVAIAACNVVALTLAALVVRQVTEALRAATEPTAGHPAPMAAGAPPPA